LSEFIRIGKSEPLPYKSYYERFTSMKLRPMVYAAVFAAVLCVISPFVIPIGPIPLSLATFAVYLAAAALDWKYAALAVLLYVLIGLAGVPVFSNFSGGFQKLVGPTGGFLIGYILCAVTTGLILKKREQKRWLYPVAMIAGTVVLYLFGTVWFMILMQATLSKALLLCVIPFLPGDAFKIILASVIAPQLRKVLKLQAA
jgi:biotin transport system substrate-specific component